MDRDAILAGGRLIAIPRSLKTYDEINLYASYLQHFITDLATLTVPKIDSAIRNYQWKGLWWTEEVKGEEWRAIRQRRPWTYIKDVRQRKNEAFRRAHQQPSRMQLTTQGNRLRLSSAWHGG